MSDLSEKAYVHSVRVAHRTIGGVAVLVNINDNTMLQLNETGTHIWSLLDGRNVAEIADLLHGRFEVSREQSMVDTREFIEVLLERGLIVEKE